MRRSSSQRALIWMLLLAGVNPRRRVMQSSRTSMCWSSNADIAARPGYPSVTVPFGSVPNDRGDPLPMGFDPEPEPYGVTFTGAACSEGTLIGFAYSFEQATQRRMPPDSAPPLKDRKWRKKRW